MKRSNEFAVGLAVLLAIALVVAGALWLSGTDVNRKQVTARARFRTVGGLGVGAPVTLRGVRVGRVEGRVQVRVRDDGHGMSAETLRRAGEPFFTTRPPGRGTGLGLFVVRLQAERLGGTLRLDSAPGAGTTANVEWPVAQAPEGRAQ